MRSSVLFLIFNRPDVTNKVFEAIRLARPKRLYVAADGPRVGREDEKQRCIEARRVIQRVDWPCEVKTLFRDENIGCRFAVQMAIDWFFEFEEEGVILEDDCLPHPDFFDYCDWALETYREHKNVWHVNGNNFAVPNVKFPKENISFGALAQVWGWATWRDRWCQYVGNPFYLERDARQKLNTWPISELARINEVGHLESLKHGLDTWDYQWQMTILNRGGLCVACKSNLISNLGDGEGATHTKKDKRVRLPVRSINGDLSYQQPSLNKALTGWYERKMGLKNLKSGLVHLLKFQLSSLRRAVENGLARSLFTGVKPIVIASTGRSGSTLLFKSISEGLVGYRFGRIGKSELNGSLAALSRSYVDRLADLANTFKPIIKTHDFFDERFNNFAKFVFVFGDPLDSAQSVQEMVKVNGRIWLDEHLYHLRSMGSLEELYEKDILNYEPLLNSWISHKSENALIIPYDELWDRVDDLSFFLGFKIELPPRKERVRKTQPKNINSLLFDHLRSVMQQYSVDERK